MSSQRLEYKKFPRGESCGEPGCNSKQYYVQDGRAFCKAHDHIWPEWRQVEEDDDDFGTQGRKTRIKKTPKQKVKQCREGREARELYYSCWQLILWKQVLCLTRPKEEGGVGLPQELEGVVRALWILRLKDLVAERADEDLGFSSQSEFGEFESGDDTSGTEMSGFSGRRRRRRRNQVTEIEITVMDTVALCYLGIVMLKLPVSVGEFLNWIEKEDIIFLEPIRFIPNEMISELPGYYRGPLHNLKRPPKPDSLHKTILNLATTLQDLTSIQFPPINYRLLTFYHVKKLGLPLEIYVATHKLAKILEFDFGFPSSECKRLPISLLPELKLICLIIIATKLAYPFSTPNHLPPRKTSSQNDHATMRLDWKAWREVMASKYRGIKKEKGKGGLVKGKEIYAREQDGLCMNGKEADDFMEWYHRSYCWKPDDENQKKPISYRTLRRFPLPPLPPHPTSANTRETQTPTQATPPHPSEDQGSHSPTTSPRTQKIKSIHASLSYQPPTTHPDPTPPEINHIHYRTVSDLPEDAKAFYEIAAHQTSLSLPTLTRAIFTMELKLVSWMLSERRRKQFNDHDEDQTWKTS